MKGRKIFAYLLVLVLLTTFLSESGLENVLAADKTVKSGSVAEEEKAIGTETNGTEEKQSSEKATNSAKKSGEEVTPDEESANDGEDKTRKDKTREEAVADEPTTSSENNATNEEAITASEEVVNAENTENAENKSTSWEKLCEKTDWAKIDTNNKTISVKYPEALTLLSNCPAENYKDYTISQELSYTGDIMTIPAAITLDGTTYNFNGLGTKECPFSGKFEIKAVKIPSALFGGLSSTAAFSKDKDKESLSITVDSDNWKANSSVLAESYVFQDDGDTPDAFQIKVSADAGNNADKIVTGSLVGEISGTNGTNGTLQPELTYAEGTTVAIKKTKSSDVSVDNAGLLCNTILSGTLDTSKVTVPSSYTVNTDNGAAGGIVGEMQAGTTLVLGSAAISADVIGTAAAGGIIGNSNWATIKVTDSFSIGEKDNPKTIQAEDNAGGWIGKAENTIFTFEDDKEITTEPVKVTASGENGNAGGIFGFFSCEREFPFDDKIKMNGTSTVEGITSGGLVGVLVNASDNKKISIQGTSGQTFSVTSAIEGQNMGGLIGQYSQKDARASLEISNVNATSSITAKENATYGGLIGLVQNQENPEAASSAYGYVKMEKAVSNVSVTKNSDKVINYGGIIGATGADGYFLDLGNVTVSAKNAELDAANANCGGLVGNLESGVLRLHGVTDLSSAKIKNEGTTKGQLVGARNNALIYALGDGSNADENTADKNTGWTLKRSAVVKVSDIGSYGEVYRQGDNLTLEGENGLLTVDNKNHTVTVSEVKNEISSAKDFAAIAIRAQLTETGAVKFEKADGTDFDFYNAALSLAGDINLTGTGITGFMRDNGTNASNEAFADGNGFKGTLDGAGKTITLSIGEAYGQRGDSKVDTNDEGSGQIYRHKNNGLFAVTAGATIDKLNTAGTITVDSAESGKNYCGAVVAQNMSSSLIVTNCFTSVAIKYAGNYAKKSVFYVGGLVGEITADCATEGKLTMTGNTVSGSIELKNPANTTISDACMGGMIGSIYRNEDTKSGKINYLIVSPETFTLDLSDTTIDGLSMTGNASTSMGGFLGYDWNNVAVTLKNVVVKNSSSLNSEGTANFGGLVYKATGYWNVEKKENNPGIDIQSATFKGNSENKDNVDGLLVYSGRHSQESALYLEIKQGAYQIGADVTVTEKTNTKFDELVGASLSGNTNGQGVVSLATTDASENNPQFNQNDKCTTYRNVTKNGTGDQNWKANGNTRYYYNLDLIRKHKPSYTKNARTIADEKQLLTWSVSRYAADNIKGYFGAYNGKGEESVQLETNKTYDLTGYSYYPVSVGSEETLTFDGNGATIQFDNEGFDKKEATKENPATVMKSVESSQHALMHFGLFRNYIASNPKEIKTYTLTVKNMTLTGSVGQTATGLTSGALICETVEGAVTNNTTINTHSLSISDITMDNLYVTGHKDSSYAPLLINKIGSYTSVSLNKVKANYTKSTENMPALAASSLIGDAGGEKAQNISLSFSSIALQDGAKEKESAMFSRAMLLNSFRYPSGASCAAVYNFDLADDWTNKAWTHHNTTYGNEISESVEYEDEEHWYYDTRKKKTDIYVNETDSGKSGTAENAPKFETYKPYVFENSIKNKSEEYHEIKVNVYVVDILNGCGTYGHPFQIDSADELVAIADYIRTGSAGSGWVIRSCEDFLNGNENDPHYENNSGSCSEYTYSGSQWLSGENIIAKEAMHEYMRNAYYQIVNDITLDSTFCGLGYDNKTAFRGVIVGKAKDDGTYPTITLKNSSLKAENASHGLINNSYGSVVMNLTVKLSKDDSEPIELNEDNKSEAIVNNYYGSVMGQILGGDNFIDNVKVEFDEDVMNLIGTYKHLIPVGGYVGIAQGGSLIFRNMESASGLTDKKIKVNNSEYNPAIEEGKYFYINPYVGRVLDGCAFYENTDQSKKLDNTNKNYQIATIDPEDKNKIQTKIEKKERQYFLNTEFSDAQSLLILSTIINSGAAGGGKISNTKEDHGSFAYYGGEIVSLFGNKDYGKARNASYIYVGNNSKEAEKDFKTSMVDDHKLVTYDDKASKIGEKSNVPYLVTKYTDSSGLTYFCSARDTRVSLKFTGQDKTVDMRQYQSGYRGIAGRYKSASIQTDSKQYNADRNTPFISSFDGNKMNLLLDMSVKEYSDDNYHAIGVGGFFNILQQDNNDSTKNITNELKNISITGTIGLSYHNKDGQQVDTNDAFSVGVGALAGRSANRSRDGEYYYADVKNVTLENLQVSAPYNAGGIFGLGGVNSYAVDGLRHSNVATNVFAAHYLSCKLNDVTIVSEKNAGALLGWGAANAKDTNDTSTSSQNNNPTYSVDSCQAANVTIKSREEASCPEAAAVFIGKCDGSLTVTSSSVTNSSVKANYAGMVSGQIRANSSRKFSATDTNITGDNSNNSILEATACAGGLVGYSEVKSTMERCTISNTSITAKTEGGLVGEVTQQSDIYGCKVSGVNFNNPSNSTSTLAGALIGKLSAGLTGGNLLWDTNTYEDGITTKGTWIGSLEKKENNKIQLAGVSRKDTQKDTSLSDVGSDEYDGYISYADYTVKNESAPLPDSTVNNSYPEAVFDTKKSLTLAKGEFIYLGEGKWTIEADSKSYVQIDNKNLLTAKEVGTAKITKENVTYTINVVESFVGTEILLKNGTYNSNGEVEYNGKTLPKWSIIINGYFSSSGTWGAAGRNISSVLKIPMEDGYTYKITYGEKNDGSENYPWGRMRLRVGEKETSAGDGKKENGWMSNKDKDANTDKAKKAYTIYDGNEVEITGRKNQSIFLNYDNFSDKSGEIPGYRFDTKEDKELFKSITVTRTSKISERSGYDSLQLISMPKLTFTNGEEIDKSQMKFVLYESATGIMRAVDSSKVALSTSKVTAENSKITANYNGQSCEIVVKVMPYGENDPVKVVYSPVGKYQDNQPFSGDFGTLYGDAVYNYDSSGTVKNNVDLICQEKEANKVEEKSGRVLYTTTGVKNFDSSHKMSTYQIQQKKIEQIKTAGFSSDFRVLLVSGSSAQSDIEQYLNLLTNGGYSKAVSQEGVTAKSETYQWDGSTFKDTKTSSLTVSNSGKTSLSYALGKSYDNGNDQFTLLTVTFTSGTHTQVVYVPIIVRRIVEVNFKATLNEESIFRDKAYDDLTEHVLVEYGSNMTGYLTWTYNKSGKETTEYDWQSYMESGAALTQGFEKIIIFDCSDGYLPAGARITLIDTQNQDHTYYYTVTENDKTDKKVEIALSAFCDASGKAYTNTAVSKLYDATAKEEAAGRFVEAESAKQATVAVSTSDGTKYYRLKKEEDKEKQTFTIELNNKKAVEENFYMVVNVPEESAEESKISSINGAVNSNVTTSAPCSITKVRRVDESGDSGNNTESTFSILSSYTQNLVDQSGDGVLLLKDTSKTVNISLLDTITFDKSQAYGAEDKLYQDFMITPYNNEQALTFLQDAGTRGTVSFEVYTMKNNEKQYYTYESGELKAATAQVKCASYEWTSQEGRMNLMLGTKNSKDAAIDLSKVRTDIMNAEGDPKIYVQLTMSLTLSDSSYNELVPASSLDNGQPKNSLRLDYISRLAKSADNLSESTWRGSCNGSSRYYKAESGCLNLNFEGDDIRQLGINLNDLSNNKPQVIDATASIDFNKWSGWKEAMEEAEKITFMFHLEQKDNEKKYKNVSIKDYLAYMKVGIWNQKDYEYKDDLIQKDEQSNSWSFTQTKANGEFANLKDGIFSLPVEYAVKISADQKGFQYANYRLVVEVSMYDKSNKPLSIPNNPDNPNAIVTSLSDYMTYTVARVLQSF